MRALQLRPAGRAVSRPAALRARRIRRAAIASALPPSGGSPASSTSALTDQIESSSIEDTNGSDQQHGGAAPSGNGAAHGAGAATAALPLPGTDAAAAAAAPAPEQQPAKGMPHRWRLVAMMAGARAQLRGGVGLRGWW